MVEPTNDRLYLDGEVVTCNTQVVKIYQRRIEKFGMSGKTMFYVDELQHQTKVSQFAILLKDLVRPEDSLLDIGCGYGSLAPLLPNCQYTGIDLVPEFISYAKRKYSLLDFKVQDLKDCDEVFDWCVLLGVVNSVPHPSMLLELAWQRCRKGVLVDFIDDRKLVSHTELNRFDIGRTLAQLLDLGARTVEVLTTESVWTIFVVKKAGMWLQSRPDYFTNPKQFTRAP